MNYLKLIKWRLSIAVAFSATAGFFLSAGELSVQALICFIGVFLMAGGSAGFNQIQEREIDKKMSRTAGRPLPSDSLYVGQALTFSVLCVITGGVLLSRLGWMPWVLGLANIFFYNGLYTPLKRRSVYALLPGGLVGAIPPIIGWTAAGGEITHPNILYLATLLFLWQIPHFWLLVIKHGKEYEKAGFKSISQHLDGKQIRRLVFYWILISSVFLASYPIFGIQLNLFIGLLLIGLNVCFILAFYWFLFRVKDNTKIKPAFILTNIFLVVVLMLLIIDSLL